MKSQNEPARAMTRKYVALILAEVASVGVLRARLSRGDCFALDWQQLVDFNNRESPLSLPQ